MNICTLDYESFWDSDYTLSKMTTEAYIRDPRFKAHLVGLKMNDRPAVWVPEEQIPAIFDKIKWHETAVLMHHAHFDQAITTWRCGINGAYYLRGALPPYLQNGIQPMFILDTLSMFRALYPAEAASLSNMVKVLGVGEKGFEVENTRGKYDLTEDEMRRLGDYCANDENSDLNLTWRAWLKMKGQFPLSELRLIDMTVRMFSEPALRLDPVMLQAVYEDDRERTLQLFEKAMPELAVVARKAIYEDDAEAWGKLKKPLSSNEQFAQLLLNIGIDPPKKISPAVLKKHPELKLEDPPIGLLTKVTKKIADEYKAQTGEPHPDKVWTYGFGKSDEDFKRLLDHPNPEVVTLVEARLGVKSTIKETRSKRMMGISERGWFPIYLAYYKAHCVPGHVEVLTRGGWVRLDAWTGGEIAQVHTDQRIEFLPASRFIGPQTAEWVKVSAPYLDEYFTPGHTMPYLKHGSFAWGTKKAGGIHQSRALYVPLAGELQTQGGLSPEQMRVLCMVQADGSFEQDTHVGRRLAIFVKKPRKIIRARHLLTIAGVKFEEQTYDSWPGYVRFIVRHRDYPEWLSPERKYLGAWILDSTPEAREAFMQEVSNWDGWVQGGKLYYSSSDEVNRDWFTTLCHLTNRCASYSVYYSENQNRRPNFIVGVRQRSYGLITPAKHVAAGARGSMQSFCAETQTGFWLARSGDRIFVTGNTGRYGGGDKMNPQNFNRSCHHCGGEGKVNV